MSSVRSEGAKNSKNTLGIRASALKLTSKFWTIYYTLS